MAETVSTLNSILRENWVSKYVQEQFHTSRLLLTRLERKTFPMIGGTMRVPLQAWRNEGVGAITESGALPAAGARVFKEVTPTRRLLAGRVRLSELEIQAAEGGGALAPAIRGAIDDTLASMRDDVNRQLYGDQSGILALVNEASGTDTVITTDTGLNVVGNDSMKYLRPGMVVSIGADTDKTITAIGTTAAPSITVASTAFLENEEICRSGCADIEFNGLQNLVAASGAFDTLNPATAGEEFWASTIGAATAFATGKGASEITDLIWSVEQAGSGKPDLMITSREIQSLIYEQLYQAYRRVNSMQFDGGFAGIGWDFSGRSIPIIVEKMCPYDHLYLLDTSHLFFGQCGDLHWLDRDGSILKQVAGFALYEGSVVWFANLTTNARNSHGAFKAFVGS